MMFFVIGVLLFILLMIGYFLTTRRKKGRQLPNTVISEIKEGQTSQGASLAEGITGRSQHEIMQDEVDEQGAILAAGSEESPQTIQKSTEDERVKYKTL